MVLGLGTGSTVRHLLDEIARRRAAGEWPGIAGVPTSEETRRRAGALAIPLTTLDLHPSLDLAIDGADEVDPSLNLIKGLGGALLREKVVARAARALVIVADQSKRVDKLGTLAPLPVEVDPFGALSQAPFLRQLGAEPSLRLNEDGKPFLTDGGHYIYHCRFPGGIDDPKRLEQELAACPGVIESGLFIGMADAVAVAGPDGVRWEQR